MKNNRKKDISIESLRNYLALKEHELEVAKLRVSKAKINLETAISNGINKNIEELSLTDLISDNYFIPEENEPCVFKTSTDILNDLIKSGKIDAENMNSVKIGLILKKIGFQKRTRYIDKYSVWGYDVIKLY